VGRFDEAIAEAKRAQELDPLSPIISGSVGVALLFSKKYDEAIEQYKKTLQMDPNIGLVHIDLAYVYALKKLYPESVAEWQALMTTDEDPALAATLGETYRVSGYQGLLQNLLDHFQKDSPARQRAYEAARLLTLLGKKTEAVRSLQKALADHEGGIVWVKSDPVFEPLHSDPDFQAIVTKMNFPN
jgi:tetratricopeptide (TPR) repeat protein